LLTQRWWQDATTGIHGVSRHHEQVVAFTVRQLLDMLSPANFVLTNPEVLARTWQTGGANLAQGFANAATELQRLLAQAPPAGSEAFRVGIEVAATPGKVVFRNHLIELIQYAPVGAAVQPEPVLIIPAWIMKYYILDLSPANSLIRYMVAQGHTVFCVSWRNPQAEDRDLGMDDYLRQGVMEALDAVQTVLPQHKVHAVGYCLGGTLLAIAAAAMGRDGDNRLASLSLFAAQTDFSEPGELALFIDDSQVRFIEDIMWEQGYLDNQQMAGAFELINSNDLVWSRLLRDYLMGERRPLTDLMAWNADGTRLPYRMHSEYLRRLFLNNDLANGRYGVGAQPVVLSDIRCPIYCVATEHDHVAPWQSVYKLNLQIDTDNTFLLSSGGHNVGIVNPPGVPKRSYQVLARPRGQSYLAPQAWLQVAPLQQGSWWPHWSGWLQQHSGTPVAPPALGGAKPALLGDAPGSYVLQK
jgi:polyhydroxyalkanoate synthase